MAEDVRPSRGRALTAWLVTLLVVLAGLITYGVVNSRTDPRAGNARVGGDDTEDGGPGVSTGTESIWDVKVGSDPQAHLVRLRPVPTTIAWLTSQRPSTGHRVAPIEFTVYTVTATLTDVHEEHDLDEHMSIEDDDGRHILVELPAVSVSTSSVFFPQIRRAHAELAAWRGTTPTRVQVTGVGFFDEPTGQSDQAPNQIELHPVLDIQFDQPRKP